MSIKRINDKISNAVIISINMLQRCEQETDQKPHPRNFRQKKLFLTLLKFWNLLVTSHGNGLKLSGFLKPNG